MVEPITAYPLIASLARPELTPLTPPALPQVSAADQARFQEALRPPLETTMAPPKTAGSEIRLPPTLTPGDAILQNLDKIRRGYQDMKVDIEAAIQQPELSPQALLHLQIQVSQVTLNTQLFHQVANKVEQDMNSLLKSS